MSKPLQEDTVSVEEPSFFYSSWRGEQPLWKAYWLNFTAIPLFLGFIGDIVPDTWVTVIAYLIVVAIVYVWALVSVWRCAQNASRPIWGVLARGIVIISPFFLILSFV